MATRGRKPKPAAIKLLTGNPGRRPIPESSVEFTGEVAAPLWIDEKPSDYRLDFLGEWGRITRQLTAWGIIGEVNQGEIEAICTLYAEAIRAARNGDATGVRQSFDGYRKALNEFGLTPASKERIGAGGTTKPQGKLSKYTG